MILNHYFIIYSALNEIFEEFIWFNISIGKNFLLFHQIKIIKELNMNQLRKMSNRKMKLTKNILKNKIKILVENL